MIGSGFVSRQTKRNQFQEVQAVRIRESEWDTSGGRFGRSEQTSLRGTHIRLEVVSMKFAQAVIAEAEPHRRRLPNFACGRP
jgi:hypothetical protein